MAPSSQRLAGSLRYQPGSVARTWKTSPVIRADLIAALTVTVFTVPEGIAYANLAGLPPAYGLYTSMVPLLLYSLLASSRHLQVGPVALISVLLAAILHPLNLPPEATLQLAISFSLGVGLLTLLFRALRLSRVIDVLSLPVLAGFCSAAGLLIALSQVHDFLGMPKDSHNHKFLGLIYHTLTSLDEVHLPTLGVSLVSLAILLVCRKISHLLPGPLLAVMAGSAAVLAGAPVERIASIPASLPSPDWPVPAITLWQSGVDLQFWLSSCLSLALVGLVESVSVARALATQNGYKIDTDRELLALGAANVVGAFFQAYPAAGSLTKSAVNIEAGGRTSRSGAFAAIGVAIIVVLCARLLIYIPKCTLAAIVMVAVTRLVDLKTHRRTFRISRGDGWVGVATLLATLLLGVEDGILIGVLASFGRFVARLSRLNVETVSETDTELRLAVKGPLYFATTAAFEGKCAVREGQALVLDFAGVTELDVSGEHALRLVHEGVRNAGGRLVLENVNPHVMGVLERSHFLREPDVEYE